MSQPPGGGAAALAQLSRITALSDGVFSIVITLLIFDVKVPVSPDPLKSFNQLELAYALLSLFPRLLSYVATFIIIGIYWNGHHAIFKHIENYDRHFLWLNNLFLMCVCFMPFPTTLMGIYWETRLAVLIYGISLILTGASLALLWRYATKNHRLVNKTLSPKVISLGHQRIMMAPLAAMISILCSSASVQLSLWIYVIAVILYLFPSRLDAPVENAGVKASG